MDKSKYTPMMQHYLQMKEENPDAILMYRLGDFYEMFFDDALTASRELDLVLTGRSAGAEKAPMCGIPHRAAKGYISRLVKKGYKVAICEQLEDPKQSKGLVERGIVKIITPGTLLDEEAGNRSLNYLAAIVTDGWKAALLLCELSTGELRVGTVDKSLSQMLDLLAEYEVREVVIARNLDKTWQKALESQEELVVSRQSPAVLSPIDEGLLASDDPLQKLALEVLLGYLQETQKQHADHLTVMKPLFCAHTMTLDSQTRIHLELIRSQSSALKAVSLWEFMDQTQSAMGSRLLREWIESPLREETAITRRQEGVQTLIDQYLVRAQLKDHLAFIYDLERLAARISYRSASPRDILQLAASLEHADPILDLAQCLESYPELAQVDRCQELYDQLKNAIVDEPPLTIKDGNFIAPGFSAELDQIRKLADQSDQALMELEEQERERTGIKNLKIGYNRVFGYFVEVRKSQVQALEEAGGYRPKQTLANSSRYGLEALEVLQEQILSAQEKKIAMEQQIFDELLQSVKNNLARLHALSSSLALVDVLTSLAELAIRQGYVRPEFTKDGTIDIQEGRHPILETRLSGFVSNNWNMAPDMQAALVTGPNMGGKSTWLRQNALIVIMAQMGSFVPARQAKLPVFDRIFTRIGASDDLLQGKSTFMVEMMEANRALRQATEQSLILFDEIGRGTATFDGMALAQAMLEYLHSVIHARTLFSTHYHELTELEKDFPAIRNVHVDVRENKKEIEFRYRIVEGKADKSYGIHVAKLAGLPNLVLERAKNLLTQFEMSAPNQNLQPELFVMDAADQQRADLIDRIKSIDADDLSARQALELLYSLKRQADLIE